MGSKSPEGHQQTPDGTISPPPLTDHCADDVTKASKSNGLKPANAAPKVAQGGSSSADLDRGIVSDDDDDDNHDNEAAAPGMKTSTDAGTSLHVQKKLINTFEFLILIQ